MFIFNKNKKRDIKIAQNIKKIIKTLNFFQKHVFKKLL